LTGGVGNDSIDGGKGVDRLVETGASFVLVQGSLSGLGADVLVNNTIEEASLTGDDSANTIDASQFTGKTFLFGNGGDDDLHAGAGGGALLGGAGADQLLGGAGRDILIGGLGLDVANGGAGEDILIGGATIHDDDKAALDVIAAEWTRKKGSYAVRIEHLLGPKGGMNKTAFLNAATVSHDGLANDLTGGQENLDWFLVKDAVDLTDADPNTETRTLLA
jgi:Ca2+-binding RTX toxin-like protein